MDVQDRMARLDVVTATSAPASSPGSPGPQADPNAPSFADSLSRPARNSTSNSTDESSRTTPQKTAGATPDQPASVAQPSAQTTPSASSTPNPSEQPAARAVTPESSAETESVDSLLHHAEVIDETTAELLAELVSAAAFMPEPVSPVARQDSPEPAPPASLMTAWQGSIIPPESSETTGEQPAPISLPTIPAGLQIGLSARAAPVFTPSNSATIATTGKAAENASASDDQAAVQATASAQIVLADEPQSVSTIAATSGSMDISKVTPAPSPQPAKVEAKPAVGEEFPVQPVPQTATAAPLDDSTIRQDQTDDLRPKISSANPLPQLKAAVKKSDEHGSQAELLNFSTTAFSVPASDLSSLPNSGLGTTQQLRAANDSSQQFTGSEIQAMSGSAGWSPVTASVVPTAVVSAGAETTASHRTSQTPNLVEQLQPALRQAITQDRELTMTLRPPELGTVRIDVQHREGQLSARLQTDTATAHQLLSDQLPHLREVLSSMGVAADQVQVVRTETAMNSSSAGLPAETQRDPQQSGARQESQPRNPEPQRIDEPEREEAGRPAILSRTALNLRI